jgi:hypothetical protein
MANTGAVTIANDAVEQAMIADDAVGADQLASNAVVNASVASGAAIADTKISLGTAIQAYDADTAKTDVLQTWTKPQVPATQTATISTSVVLDFDTYQNFILTLGSGVNTLTNPTTEASNVGQTGVMLLIQPSSGAAGTLATGTDYETVGGTALTLSSTNSQYDVVPYLIKGTSSILIGSPQLNFS